MGRRIRRKNSLVNNMNVVPYIDVMLVLLVIFMVTAPMFVPAIINLPSVGKASQMNKSPIQININKEGNYSIIQNSKSQSENNLDSLANTVKILAIGDTAVVISADKEVIYNTVITVVDKLYSVGIKKVGLVVKEKNG